jgi:hypothetical protein
MLLFETLQLPKQCSIAKYIYLKCLAFFSLELLRKNQHFQEQFCVSVHGFHWIVPEQQLCVSICSIHTAEQPITLINFWLAQTQLFCFKLTDRPNPVHFMLVHRAFTKSNNGDTWMNPIWWNRSAEQLFVSATQLFVFLNREITLFLLNFIVV